MTSIRATQSDGIAVLTLDRPDRYNALDRQTERAPLRSRLHLSSRDEMVGREVPQRRYCRVALAAYRPSPQNVIPARIMNDRSR
jgi:hypothetical protein